jgi:hypothetical protein
MKSMITMMPLGLLAIAVATAMPAWAQEPGKFTGFLCELDLSDIKNKSPGVPASVFTFDSTKQCPGQTEDITIECLASIPEWTGSASTNENVPCRINGDQCGVLGFVDATKSTLDIDSDGKARLFCSR